MSWKRIMMAVAGAAAVWCAAPVAVTRAAQAGPAGAGWGQAIEVPGAGTLNTGGLAEVVSVSCASAGNCAAGGGYSDGFGNSQAFVASQRNGRWGTAIEVPGLGPLNLGGLARVNSVSCASAGNCTAGGYTTGGSGRGQAFVVSERNGRWGTAIVVPGTQALNAGGLAQVSSVSCASAGNCAAGGIYNDGFRDTQAFVASQRNGRWGKAIEVPGMAALNPGGAAWIWSVSCASAGNCAAGGYISAGGFAHPGAFVVGQRNGRWGKAIRVPGTGKLNVGHNAQVLSVSCPSAGNCAAGGYYTARSGGQQTFVASERNGRWGTAINVPGTVTVNPNAKAEVESVSCPSAGNCAAGGFYYRSGQRHAFVVSQRNRRWRTAITVPGTDTSAGGLAAVISVSCYSGGNCVAGGYYAGSILPPGQAFLASERNGRWGKAIEVPGTATLNTGKSAEVSSVSCNRTGACTAGGSYETASNTPPYIATQGFVVSRS